MVVDEPDRQDLNELYPKMLAAGVQFFDRPMKEEEVRIDPSKTGRVTLGPLEILETTPPAKAVEESRPSTRLP